MRIGRIPSQTWRQNNIPAHAEYSGIAALAQHDVMDFKPVQRQAILAANQAYIANNILNPAKAARLKGGFFISDHSANALRVLTDYMAIIAEVDHIIPYQHWGSNDYRNARVLSKAENVAAGIARPGVNDIEYVCHDTINFSNRLVRRINAANAGVQIAGPNLAAQHVLTLVELQWLLDYADAEYMPHGAGHRQPTHKYVRAQSAHSLTNLIQVSDNDLHAIYYNLPQN